MHEMHSQKFFIQDYSVGECFCFTISFGFMCVLTTILSYSRLVSRINSIVHKGGTHDAHRISILDIFGFEDLAENSFEQLCISQLSHHFDTIPQLINQFIQFQIMQTKTFSSTLTSTCSNLNKLNMLGNASNGIL